MKKRVLSLLMSAAMVFTLLPTPALAALAEEPAAAQLAEVAEPQTSATPETAPEPAPTAEPAQDEAMFGKINSGARMLDYAEKSADPVVEVTCAEGNNTSVYGDTAQKTFSIAASGFTTAPTSYSSFWCTQEGTEEGPPASAGNLAVGTVTAGNATLTLTPYDDAPVGTYYFKAVGGEVGSNVITYTITQPVYGTEANPCTTAEQLAAALNTAQAGSATASGSTATMSANISALAATIYVAPASGITLDLNGHSITGKSGTEDMEMMSRTPGVTPLNVVSGSVGIFTVANSDTSNEGSIAGGDSSNGTYGGNGVTGALKVDGDGNVTITGGNSGTDCDGSNGVAGDVVITGSGTVNITGGNGGGGYYQKTGGSGVSGAVTVSGSGDVNITGGVGGTGVGYNDNGGAGGSGVSGEVTISGSGDVTLTGGNGGTGVSSSNVGGTGGSGVSSAVTISGSGNVALTGGAGGIGTNNATDGTSGKALMSTITATGMSIKGGDTDSTITTDITSGSTTAYRYVTVTPPYTAPTVGTLSLGTDTFTAGTSYLPSRDFTKYVPTVTANDGTITAQGWESKEDNGAWSGFVVPGLGEGSMSPMTTRTYKLRYFVTYTDNSRASQTIYSNEVTMTIVGHDTTLTLTASPASPQTAGTEVTLTATLTGYLTAAGLSGQSITFKNGSDTLGTETLNSSGVATLTWTPSTANAYSLSAEYAASPYNKAATGTLSYTASEPYGASTTNPCTTAQQLAAALNRVAGATVATASGSTVTMSANISALAETIYVAPTSGITLDLNGKSIKGADGGVGQDGITPLNVVADSAGKLMLTGSGTITGGNGGGQAGTGGNAVAGNVEITGTGTVNLTGGTGSSASSGDPGGNGVNGNVKITGSGTVNLTGGSGGVSFSGDGGMGGNGVAGNVEITGSGIVNLNGGSGGGTMGEAGTAGKALTGTLTADGDTVKGGSSADPTTVVTSNYNTYQYLTIAPPTHAHCICGGSVNVGDHTSHSADITYTAIPANFAGGELEGSIYLDRDVNLTSTLKVASGKTLNLCLNGYKLSANGGAFSVIENSRGTLNLCDCNGSNHTYYGKWDAGKTAYEISNTASAGADTIVGGVVTGALECDYGGGISNRNNGTANLYSGTVAGNKTKSGTSGGGVNLYGGATNLYAAKIISNIAGYGGGGICEMGNASVTMYGGEVKNNTAVCGGGVYISHSSSGNNATFTLFGGEISGNTASQYGGGIYAHQPYDTGSVTLNLKGGSITGNTATSAGGGVYTSVNGAAQTINVNLSGNVTIQNNKKGTADNNLRLVSGKTINIAAALTNKVGVTT